METPAWVMPRLPPEGSLLLTWVLTPKGDPQNLANNLRELMACTMERSWASRPGWTTKWACVVRKPLPSEECCWDETVVQLLVWCEPSDA